MKTLAASLSILTQQGVMLYLLRGVAFTCIISVLGVILGLIVGSLLALARTYCKHGPARVLGWLSCYRLHRAVPQHALPAVDLRLRGLLPLPGILCPENVRPDQRGDEAPVQGSAGSDPVQLLRHCGDRPRRPEWCGQGPV